MSSQRSGHFPRWVLVVIPVFFVLHLNVWMWDSERLILGWPVNLAYHVGLTVAVTAVMIVLVRRAWPASLEED